jgi:O-antigen ligase
MSIVSHSGIEEFQMPPYRPGMNNHVEKVQPDRIASVVMIGTLAGFLIVSYIPGMLGVDSRVVTVPFRGLMLLVLFYALYRLLAASHIRFVMSVTTLLVVFFWTIYSARFTLDAALMQVPLGMPPSEMALSLFGMCIPTFVVLYLIRDIRLYRSALRWTMLGLGICCLASMFRTRTSQDVVLHGRYQANEILNPISYGHMGVTAIILGLFVVLQIGHTRTPWLLRLLAAATVCLGAFSIFAASSRGALVAGILLVPIVGYLGLRRGSRLLTIGICIVLGFVLSATVTYLSQSGPKLERMISAAAYNSANDSVNSRQNSIRDAWHEYLDHPLLGSSMVERNALFYPHNAIVEAYMATGTFGGTAFVLLLLIAIGRAIRFIGRDPEMAWVPLCFFQQFIGAMFSGGLYSNVALWGMMAIMLGADLPRIRRASGGQQ